MDALEVLSDPEEPDDARYRVVDATAVRLRVVFPDDSPRLMEGAHHVFHLVRGDAAARVVDQPGDADHWYVRKWVEQPPALLAEATGSEAGSSPLGVLALPNPASPALSVSLTRPSRRLARLGVGWPAQGWRPSAAPGRSGQDAAQGG